MKPSEILRAGKANEALERVARAISPEVFDVPLSAYNRRAYATAYKKAVAAISALRLPTEAMIDDGMLQCLDYWSEEKGIKEITNIYTAMIDQALP